MTPQIVKDEISRDLEIAVETILDGVRRGEVTGIAFACSLKKMRFFTNVAGLCYRNPTFARGMVASLDDELSSLVHGRDPQETR